MGNSLARLLLSFLVGGGCARAPAAPPAPATGAAVEGREQVVTEQDLRLLERADQLLGDASRWDRSDDRTCAPGAPQVSLFCALERACVEVLGSYQHRRVAMQEVRFAIEDVSGGRAFEHRLMDFNNLPETTFADIKKVLTMARERVAARLGGRASSR